MKPDNLTIRNFWEYQQVVIMSLHLHLEDDLKVKIEEVAQVAFRLLNIHRNDEPLDSVDAILLIRQFEITWKSFTRWLDEFTLYYSSEAVDIVLGVLAFYHNNYFLDATPVQETFGDQFKQEVINAARDRLIANINYSQRLLNTQQSNLLKFKQIINAAVADGSPVSEIALRLSTFMNPELKTGASYFAKMLVRTEVQNIYHQALAKVFAAAPWVNKLQFKMSEGHKHKDICDQYSDEVFEIGQVSLPLHPNCMCYWKPMLESKQKIRIWRNGKAILTDYESLIGPDINVRLEGEVFQKIFSWT